LKPNVSKEPTLQSKKYLKVRMPKKSNTTTTKQTNKQRAITTIKSRFE